MWLLFVFKSEFLAWGGTYEGTTVSLQVVMQTSHAILVHYVWDGGGHVVIGVIVFLITSLLCLL